MMLVPKRDNDLFAEFFDDPFFNEGFRAQRPMPMMKTDIRESDTSFMIDVDLPGYNKEDIKLDIHNGYLNINAKTSSAKEEQENGRFLRRERFQGECSRSFYVGEDINEDEIKASFNNGILTIEVPKKLEEYEEDKKYIEII